MEFRKLTQEEIARRRKRNIAMALSLGALSLLFFVTTMIRISENLGSM